MIYLFIYVIVYHKIDWNIHSYISIVCIKGTKKVNEYKNIRLFKFIYT